MELSLIDLLLLLGFGAACVYFLAYIRVRELATQAVLQASERDDFQLLDQAVHINRVSLSRDDKGQWRVWRQFRFDYSYDGVERRQGYVVMLGPRFQSLLVSERQNTIH